MSGHEVTMPGILYLPSLHNLFALIWFWRDKKAKWEIVPWKKSSIWTECGTKTYFTQRWTLIFATLIRSRDVKRIFLFDCRRSCRVHSFVCHPPPSCDTHARARANVFVCDGRQSNGCARYALAVAPENISHYSSFITGKLYLAKVQTSHHIRTQN